MEDNITKLNNDKKKIVFQICVLVVYVSFVECYELTT